MAAADKMLRALLRSVDLGVIYQLGVSLYGMDGIHTLYGLYYIHWVQKARRNPPARKRICFLCLVNLTQTKFSNFLDPFKLLKRFSWSVILQETYCFGGDLI